MPISAPTDGRQSLRLGAAASGFTLIEILLVLVIIGITVGLAALTLTGNPATDVDREARRLLAVLDEASAEAVAQGAEIALALSSDPDSNRARYQLLKLDREDRSWRAPDDDLPVSEQRFWLPHTVAEGIDLELEVEGRELNPRQLEAMARVRALDAPDALQPSILLLSSGETTPFTLHVYHRRINYSVSVTSDGISGVFLQ